MNFTTDASTVNQKLFWWYVETKDRHLAWLFGLELNTK